MRAANILWDQEPTLRLVADVKVDPPAARDYAPTDDEAGEFDQSLPVPWEWWTPGSAAN